ncbi:MAG: Hcp1 family type secretion system effector [Verrucomicrobiales bacterium]|nr:Hcp1 family type secretion system effector [Verrucomicrobiales bacterium]
MSLALNRISNLMALAVPAAGFFTCGKAGAASDCFIKFDGIDGESAVSGYEKQVEVLSWSFGASNPTAVTGGGGGTGKVSLQDFHFTTRVNSSSPPLMLACAKGTHIPTATFRLLKPTSTGGQQEYYVVTLHDVLISSYSSSRSPSNTASDGVPVEKVSLSFIKITMEYRPAASGGAAGNPVTATVDVER